MPDVQMALKGSAEFDETIRLSGIARTLADAYSWRQGERRFRLGYGGCTMCDTCQAFTGGWTTCQTCKHPFDRHV